MNNFIKLNSKEEMGTLPIPIKKEESSETNPIEENRKEDGPIINLDNYSAMEMKAKISIYKLSSD